MAFYAGQLRARTSVLCYHPGEPNEAELLGTLNATMGEAINPVIGRSVKGWTGILDRVLAWEDAHPDPSTANAKCAAARADVRRGLIAMRDELRVDPGAVRRKRAANGLPNDPE